MPPQKTRNAAGKIAAVTFAFWIIKILATTLGETAGDALSMTLELGYAVSTFVFLGFFLATVAAQIHAKKFHPFLYWPVIVATTTVGTTMADFADRSMGVGYVGGSLSLFALLMLVLTAWYFSTGSIAVDKITSRKVEIFYWLAILTSNTLGTAVGDFAVDASGLGYGGSALVFIAILIAVALAYFCTKISRTLLFWVAFILTRPLGSTLGDLLTKPLDHGGFNLSRISSSLILGILMIGCIVGVSVKRNRK